MTDNLYDLESIEELEQEEYQTTDEWIALMLLVLKDASKNIMNLVSAFYMRYGSHGIVPYAEARRYMSRKDHRRRIDVLIKELKGEMETAHQSLKEKFELMAETIKRLEVEFANMDKRDFDDMSLKWGTDELSWKERLKNDVDRWERCLVYEVKHSLSVGSELGHTENRVEKRFHTMGNVLTALAITESTAVSSITRGKIFRARDTDKYRYDALNDEKTCPVCGELDRRIFPVSAYEPGINASPMHTNCRCRMLPV